MRTGRVDGLESGGQTLYNHVIVVLKVCHRPTFVSITLPYLFDFATICPLCFWIIYEFVRKR